MTILLHISNGLQCSWKTSVGVGRGMRNWIIFFLNSLKIESQAQFFKSRESPLTLYLKLFFHLKYSKKYIVSIYFCNC